MAVAFVFAYLPFVFVLDLHYLKMSFEMCSLESPDLFLMVVFDLFRQM
jgi:hypothetical protein